MTLASRMAFTRTGPVSLVFLACALWASPGSFAAAQSRKNPVNSGEPVREDNPESSSGVVEIVGPDRTTIGRRLLLRARMTSNDGPRGKASYRWVQREGPALMVREVVAVAGGERTVVVPFDFGKCTASFIAFTPAEAGHFQIEVTASPAGAEPLVGSKTLVVVDPAPAPATKPPRTEQATPLLVSIRMSPATVSVSNRLVLQAFPEGGASPDYRYQWVQEDGPNVTPANGWTSRSLAFNGNTFSAGVTYGFKVTVISEGVSATATVEVAVP